MSEILGVISDKWAIIAVGNMAAGPKRFNELRRLIPDVSQRMLTMTLRRLEAEGLVIRTVTPASPPRVDYALTMHGQTLVAPLNALAEWAATHRDRIVERRPGTKRARAESIGER